MKKNKRNRRLILLLCIVEIGIGAAIAHEFLVEAISRKRILHPIEYSVSINKAENTEENNEKDKNYVNAENLEGEERAIEPDEFYEDDGSYINATCEVSHDLDSITGQKIKIMNTEESSHINQEGYSNTAYQTYDDNLSTSWQEGVDGPGKGSWLYYQLEEIHYVTDIVIYAGVWREAEGKDYYHDNCRPKEIQITLDDLKWNVSFDDNKEPQVVHFSKSVPARNISITILDVYTGNKYEDTGISEIAFYE